MSYPSISQWIDTVANPRGRFRTLGDFDLLHDAYGNIRFTAGNSAVVFPVTARGKRMMLKCFIKDGRRASYGMLSGEESLLSPIKLLPGEAYVFDDLGKGAFYDVAFGEWVDGHTLETEIRRAARESGAPRFAELAAIFDRLAVGLLSREWAHGDLKPDNIVITPAGKAVLIDYDAMYIPGCEPTGEAGTPGFQHPARTENNYGKYIDDYPVALISTSLHALALCPGLYKKYYKGDGLILNPDEICAGRSESYREVLRLFADAGEYRLYDLAIKLDRPVPAIPGIGNILAKFAAERGYGIGGHTIYIDPDEYADTGKIPQLFKTGNLWGYETAAGDQTTAAIFDEAFEFSDGLATVKLCGQWHAIDLTGKKAFCVSNADAMKPFSHGLAAFRREGKWGYVDTEGRTAVEPCFDMAGSMHDDMATVRIGGKYGFINASGQTVIPPSYDLARGFRNGLAEVQANGETFLIDLYGKRV